MVLVGHRVVEQNVAPGAECHLRAHRLPALAWREMAGFEKGARVVMRQPVQVVGQLRARIIHLAAHQKLPVRLCRRFPGFFFRVTLFT